MISNEPSRKVIDTYTTDFHSILSAFLNSTDQKIKTATVIETEILPDIQNREYFSDIGCGDGSITNRLRKHFFASLALDNNQSNLEQLVVTAPSELPPCRIENEDMNTYSPDRNSDLILFSYSIGYIGAGLSKYARDGARINKLKEYYDSLNPGGALALVGSCYDGSYKAVFDELGVPVHDELQDLNRHIEACYECTKIKFPVEVHTNGKEEMALCLRLIIYDDGTKYLDRVPRIEEYVQTFRQADGSYLLAYESEVIVIKKDKCSLSPVS